MQYAHPAREAAFPAAMEMNSVRIQTTQNVDIAFEVAGLGDRVIAAVVDYFLIFCYYVGMSMLISQLSASTAVTVLLLLPPFLYFLLCEVFMDGQSIGKRARGLKVVHLDGSEPTLGSYLLRWILRPIELAITAGAVALVTVLINGKGQRLGDLAAGTTVVKLRDDIALPYSSFTSLEDDYAPTFPKVDLLGDADIATAKEVLDTIITEPTSHATYRLGHKMKATLERKMGIASDLAPPHFLRTVVRDYNHVHGL